MADIAHDQRDFCVDLADMRVAVDARTIYAPRRRGTGKNLIDLYTTLAARRPSWEFLMLHQCETRENPFAAIHNIAPRRIDIAGDRFNLWEQVRLPVAARALGVDVLHCPANTAPRTVMTPLVVTIHDLIPLDMAPAAPSTRQWVRRVRGAARRARRILTPSEYTRRLIVDRLGAEERKVIVNHWAPDRACRRVESAEAIAAVRRKYGVADGLRYVLAFGAQDPRKNTTGILDAWRRLNARVNASARLVIVGLQPDALERYRALLAGSHASASCVLHGFADEADIAPLLTGAAALCYPSRSEGFGLPLLDAFACGTPVITSDTTSLPEVAGDAALLVDPDDPRAIATALTLVLTSEHVAARLRSAGSARLQAFSWERCAETAGRAMEAAAGAIEAAAAA